MKALVQQLLVHFRRLYRTEEVMMLVIAATIGVASAYGAILFRGMILTAERLFFGTWALDVRHIAGMPWYWRVALPALGGLLLAPIVTRFAPEAKGSGIPEVIESVALRGGLVRKRVAPFKALAAAICIGSGGSAGREGPIVHIGAAMGSWIGQVLKVPVRQMRTFVGCGVAGGIAATFNTPFAGALFAVEVVLGDFGMARISPIVIASVVATVVSRHYTGDFPRLDVPPFTETITLTTLLPYFAVGIACALISGLFILMMKGGWNLAKRWPASPYVLPVIGGLLVGVTGLAFPEVYGVGYDTINHILTGHTSLWILLAILAAKMFATTATLSSGGSGGVFAPSLFLGAAVGGFLGGVIQRIAPGMIVSPHAYALVGMGAMVAGTTRAPISAVLIIFELTNRFGVILPLMAACIPSVMISSWIHEDSLYLTKLITKGVTLRPKNEVNLLKGLKVRDVMSERVTVVSRATSLADIIDRFLESSFSILWVVDDDKRLLGMIESRNLHIAMIDRDALQGLIVAYDLTTPVPQTVHPDDDLGFVIRLFGDAEQLVLPVIDESNGRRVGDLLRNDIIETYNRELEIRDALSSAGAAISVAERAGRVDLGQGYALAEFEVPSHMIGKTLAELNLRGRANIQVVFLRRGGHRLMPGPDTRMQNGDVLLLGGKLDDVEAKVKRL